MKKIIIFLLLLVSSDCFAQYNPQFLWQPGVGNQINLAHPDAQGLSGHWLFNEGLSFTLFDLTPYGNNGTLTGPMQPWEDWIPGRDGWALEFDGDNDYIDFSSTSLSQHTYKEFTFSLWHKSRDSNVSDDEIKLNITTKPGMSFDPVTFCKWMAERVIVAMVPRFIEVYENGFPMTATQKVKVAELKDITDKTWDRNKAGLKFSARK